MRRSKYDTVRMSAAGGLYAEPHPAYSPPAANILAVLYLVGRVMPPPLRSPSEYSDNCDSPLFLKKSKKTPRFIDSTLPL